MVRGVYIQCSGSERMTLEMALKRYLNDITPTKKPATNAARHRKPRSSQSPWANIRLRRFLLKLLPTIATSA